MQNIAFFTSSVVIVPTKAFTISTLKGQMLDNWRLLGAQDSLETKGLLKKRLGFLFDEIRIRAPCPINKHAYNIVPPSPNNGLSMEKLCCGFQISPTALSISETIAIPLAPRRHCIVVEGLSQVVSYQKWESDQEVGGLL